MGYSQGGRGALQDQWGQMLPECPRRGGLVRVRPPPRPVAHPHPARSTPPESPPSICPDLPAPRPALTVSPFWPVEP